MQKFRTKWTAWLAAAAVALSLTGGAAAALTEVIPIGRTAGIRMQTDGVVVESVDSVMTAVGEVSPAKQAGLQQGDILLTVSGDKIDSGQAL